MPFAVWLAASLGKWRYFLSGAAFALLFGLVCRASGRLLMPLGVWRCFSGVCTGSEPQNGKNAVAVQFSDSRRVTHTAAFLTDDEVPAAGEEMRIALRAEVFASGAYPQELRKAAEAGGDIITGRAYRRWLRHTILRELCVQLLCCGAALALFVVVMRICFP